MSSFLKIAPFIQLPAFAPVDMLYLAPWQVTRAGTAEKLEHWDYQVDIEARRGIEVNTRAILDFCQLPAGTKIGFAVTIYSNLLFHARRSAALLQLDDSQDGLSEVSLSIEVPGASVAGELRLVTQLVVTDVAHNVASTLIPGAILWEDERSVVLESPGPRLPLTLVNFEDYPEKFDDPLATWIVDILPGGLEEPPSMGLQIYLNSKYSEFVTAVTGDVKTYDSAIAFPMLYFDIGRQFIRIALEDETFCDPEYIYEAGSLGAAIRTQIKNVFDPLTLKEIITLNQTKIQQFETMVQAAFLRLT